MSQQEKFPPRVALGESCDEWFYVQAPHSVPRVKDIEYISREEHEAILRVAVEALKKLRGHDVIIKIQHDAAYIEKPADEALTKYEKMGVKI